MASGTNDRPGNADPRRPDPRREERWNLIVDATTKCVRRYGAAKVSVEDIATAAGISRRTLYRFFPNRRDVMRAVVHERLGKIAAGVRDALRLCDGFEESVVIGTVETIRLARADAIFHSIIAEDHSLTQDDDPGDSDAPITALTNSIWQSLFKNAHEDGLFRTGIDDIEALRWLIDVHDLFDLRPDLTLEEVAVRMQRFVLPSLVKDGRLGDGHSAMAGRRGSG